MNPFKRKQTQNIPRRRASGNDSTGENASPARQFMRNRTIGGRYGSISELAQDSDRGRAHQLAAHRRKVGGVFLVVLITICLLSFLLLQLTTQVGIIGQNSKMTRAIDSKLYVGAVNDYLDRHPIERLRFVLSDDQLATYVADLYPEVASIKQRTTWGIGESQYELSLREPVAGWVIDGKQYYVDSEGIAFENNYYESPTVQIIDESGARPVSGATVTSTRFLGFIGRVVALGKARGYTVTEAKLPLGTTREADIRIEGVPSSIKLSIDRGAGEQIEDLDRTLTFLKSRSRAPSYIDLRVDGRAYYQ